MFFLRITKLPSEHYHFPLPFFFFGGGGAFLAAGSTCLDSVAGEPAAAVLPSSRSLKRLEGNIRIGSARTADSLSPALFKSGNLGRPRHP